MWLVLQVAATAKRGHWMHVYACTLVRQHMQLTMHANMELAALDR